MLIRFARRLSSWDPATPENDLLETEFRDRDRGEPDLRPSVYQIDASEVVRAYAEHATAFEPPASAGGYDLGGTGRPVEVTPGMTGFAFTQDTHREIVLSDPDDLVALVREVKASLATRSYPVRRDQVREYVRARLTDRNPEWERRKAEGGAKKWLKNITIGVLEPGKPPHPPSDEA